MQVCRILIFAIDVTISGELDEKSQTPFSLRLDCRFSSRLSFGLKYVSQKLTLQRPTGSKVSTVNYVKSANSVYFQQL